MQAELERSNERLASFAGQVSHDLKTPLTTLSLSLVADARAARGGRARARSPSGFWTAPSTAPRGWPTSSTTCSTTPGSGAPSSPPMSTSTSCSARCSRTWHRSSPTSRCTSAGCPRCSATAPSSAPCSRTCSATPPATARDERPLEVHIAATTGAARLADRDHRQRPRRTARGPAPRLRAARAGRRVGRGHRASAWPPAAGSSAPTAAGSASTRRPHRGRDVLVRAARLTGDPPVPYGRVSGTPARTAGRPRLASAAAWPAGSAPGRPRRRARRPSCWRRCRARRRPGPGSTAGRPRSARSS